MVRQQNNCLEDSSKDSQAQSSTPQNEDYDDLEYIKEFIASTMEKDASSMHTPSQSVHSMDYYEQLARLQDQISEGSESKEVETTPIYNSEQRETLISLGTIENQNSHDSRLEEDNSSKKSSIDSTLVPQGTDIEKGATNETIMSNSTNKRPSRENSESISKIIDISDPSTRNAVSDVEDVQIDMDFAEDVKAGSEAVDKTRQPTTRKESTTGKGQIKINKYFIEYKRDQLKDHEKDEKATSILPQSIRGKNSRVSLKKPTPVSSTSSNNSFTAEDAISLINEVNRKNEKQSKQTSTKPSGRYVLGRNKGSANIKDVIELADLKSRELFGILHRNAMCWLTYNNWVVLKGSELICYNHKGQTVDVGHTPDKPHFQDPTDSDVYYLVQYSIDLKNSQVYLACVHDSRGCSTLWCYSKKARELKDISNSVIRKIDNCGKNRYLVELMENGNDLTLILDRLELVVMSEDVPHSYSCNSVDIFLKWIIAIQLRRGRNNCIIG